MNEEALEGNISESANIIAKFTHRLLESVGISESSTNLFNLLICLALVLMLVYVLQFSVKRLFYFLSVRLEKIAKSSFFRHARTNKLPSKLAMIVPYILVKATIPIVLVDYAFLVSPCEKAVGIVFVFIVISIIMSALHSFADMLQEKPSFENKPVKSYLQVIYIVLLILGTVAIYSILTGKSATVFFTAMGAMSAVLMLVFKDPILGFVASIQISSNEMVQIGDWITMSKHGADGTVEEINLTNVKVRNFDKTITTIPTYALISDSFQNWRGMKESGGRRLKRSLLIKQAGIYGLTDTELERYKKMPPLTEYITRKQAEYLLINENLKLGGDSELQGFRITNCDLFMQYATWYLQNNPEINAEMTLMVRQLTPTEKGLPIELYIFTGTTVWTEFERISGEIINHLISTIHVFDLTVFEVPASADPLVVHQHIK